MFRQKRNFSAKFKSDLVIELLKGEKDLNTLAVENNIQPNLLRNWKKEFLDNAFAVFDDKREDNLKEKLAEERKEKAEYAKKVGQLIMQVDWLKKNLKKFVDLTTRVSLVQNLLTTKEIPASGNLYQIFAYVKNLDRNQTGNVAGMLLYAKTQEQTTPNNKYSMDGNTIWVRTLDLNLPFPQIAEQLEKIAGDYFGSGKFDRTGIGTDRRCKEIIEYGI